MPDTGQDLCKDFYEIFMSRCALSSPSLRSKKYDLIIIFNGGIRMDFAFLLGAALLWGVTALLVKAFGRLDQAAKGQS
jgi:hypothetical protein